MQRTFQLRCSRKYRSMSAAGTGEAAVFSSTHSACRISFTFPAILRSAQSSLFYRWEGAACVAGRPADSGELQSEPCSVQDGACVPPTLPFGPSLTSLHTPEGSSSPP